MDAEHENALRQIAEIRHRDLQQRRNMLVQEANQITMEMAEIENVYNELLENVKNGKIKNEVNYLGVRE